MQYDCRLTTLILQSLRSVNYDMVVHDNSNEATPFHCQYQTVRLSNVVFRDSFDRVQAKQEHRKSTPYPPLEPFLFICRWHDKPPLRPIRFLDKYHKIYSEIELQNVMAQV